MKKIKAKKGFTLPEILVAASIMISLFALISATLWDYSKISVKAQIELRIQEKLRNAMNKLDKEILLTTRAVLPYYRLGTNSSNENLPISKCFPSSVSGSTIKNATVGTSDCIDGNYIRTSTANDILILSTGAFDRIGTSNDGEIRERYDRFNPTTNNVIILYKTFNYGREQLRMARFPAKSIGMMDSSNKHRDHPTATTNPAPIYSSLTVQYSYRNPTAPTINLWREKPKVVNYLVFDYLSPRKPKVDTSGKPNLRVKKPVGDSNKDGDTYNIFSIFRDPFTSDISGTTIDERLGSLETLVNPIFPPQNYSPLTSISSLYTDSALQGFSTTYNHAGAVVGFKIEIWGAEDYGDGYVARSRDNYIRLDFDGGG